MTMQTFKREKEQFKTVFGQRVKKYVLDLIRLIDSLPHERSCRVIGDQLMRSGTSIGANYFEARAASSKNDFTNYFTHALKSANESKFWLEILIETDKCDKQQAGRLFDECCEIANILASSILTLKGKRKFQF